MEALESYLHFTPNVEGEYVETHVEEKVNTFLRLHPYLEYLREDLIGEGTLAIVEAAQTVDPDTNPAAYFGTAITNAISDYAAEYTSLASNRTQKRRLDQGETVARQISIDERLSAAVFDRPEPETKVHDMRETIRSVCEDGLDLDIVRLREEGYKDREIGKQLGHPKSTVAARRKKIEERFALAL